MNAPRTLIILAMALLLALGAVWACDDDDDDDSDASPSDDDNGDDDNDDTPADDDTAGNDDDDDDDDDDNTPEGPAPLLDGLTLLPDEGFADDWVSISIHWQDLEDDVSGGEVELFLDGISFTTFTAVTAGENSGFIDFAITLPTDIEAGNLLFEVTLTDMAGNKSNMLGATFRSSGINTAPVISNLRFDPDPACTEDGASFAIIFDYNDAEANMDGGSLSIIINGQFPPLVATLQGTGPPQGTLALTFGFDGGVPNGEVVNFVLQMADNRGLASNPLSGNLTFLDSACGK